MASENLLNLNIGKRYQFNPAPKTPFGVVTGLVVGVKQTPQSPNRCEIFVVSDESGRKETITNASHPEWKPL